MRLNGWILSCGIKYHYVNNKLHCEDGPAVIFSNSECAWYYNDYPVGWSWNSYTQGQFETWKKFIAFL